MEKLLGFGYSLTSVSLDHPSLLLLIPSPSPPCTPTGFPAVWLWLHEAVSQGAAVRKQTSASQAPSHHVIPFAFPQPAALKTTLLTQLAEAPFSWTFRPACSAGCPHEPLHQALQAVSLSNSSSSFLCCPQQHFLRWSREVDCSPLCPPLLFCPAVVPFLLSELNSRVQNKPSAWLQSCFLV